MILIFALVKIKYNAEKSTTGLGNIVAKLSNNMTQPGDCLNDMLTNTRYGAGIAAADIKSS